MSAPEQHDDRDTLLEHEYDGIREYDNPLPRWWVWVFAATIVFAVGYYAFYELGPGQTIIAEYEEDVRLAAERAPRPEETPAAVSDDALAALKQDLALMASARETFAARCAPCHGPQAQGLIGPNLTDDHWIHGGRLVDIRRVIVDGVPQKGMVPFGGQLPAAEIDALVAYIASLRGTRPPNPKPPEGTRATAASPTVALAGR
jgi:cytochrome c oxidase cbb3-type subunit III